MVQLAAMTEFDNGQGAFSAFALVALVRGGRGSKKMTSVGVCMKEERSVQVGRGSGKPTLMFMRGQGWAERNDSTGQGDTTLSHTLDEQPAVTSCTLCAHAPPDAQVHNQLMHACLTCARVWAEQYVVHDRAGQR